LVRNIRRDRVQVSAAENKIFRPETIYKLQINLIPLVEVQMPGILKKACYFLLLFIIISSVVFISACAKVAPYSAVGETFDFTVTGYGLVTRAGNFEKEMLLSNRAAVVDAYRNLSERVAGLVVESYTRQGEYEVNKDVIMTETKAFLMGARVVEVEYNNYISTAIVSLPLPTQRFKWYRDASVISN